MIRKKIIKIKEKQKAQQKKNSLVLILIIFFVIVILILNAVVLWSFLPEQITSFRWGFGEGTSGDIKSTDFTIKEPLANANQVITYLPAVDKKGNGVITLLVVEAIPGSGRTLVDIDNLLFWADTQHSIRIAKNVAINVSGIDATKYDLVYNIYADASVIGGESAGAAITIATIAVLQNESLKEDVIITGTVNHDGTIGLVKGILPKAKVAKQVNAVLFLVPLLQSEEIAYETREHCEHFGPAEFCTIEQIPRKIDISEEAGITIKEVGTIKEAIEYFFEDE